MRMVSFAALAVLVISPSALISISFQMSFAAVTALIAFYERFSGRLSAGGRQRGFLSKMVLYLIGIVICDFVASLATTPFAIYHFHKIAVYTSLGNLLAGPLIGLMLMPLILVCLAALPLGMALYPLKILGYGIEMLNKITAFVSGLPHSVLYIDSLPFWGFLCIICGGCWLCLWQRSWRKWGILLIAVGVIPMFFGKQPDMVFAVNGQGIAVRDKQGDLRLFPMETDPWVYKIWQENLRLKKLSAAEKSQLNTLLANGGEAENIDLVCEGAVCLYQNSVSFDADGRIWVNEKELDTGAGGYIYIHKDGVEVKPLWNKQRRRLWQNGNRVEKGVEHGK